MLLWLAFCILTEMLPVERVAANWGRVDWPGPLYSLASLYKHAEACPSPTVTRRPKSCKHKRSSSSLATFILNWAHFSSPVHEIYQTAITPPSPLILAPVLGASVSLVILVDPGFLHVANPPNTLAKALAWVGRDVRGEVWFGSLFKRLVDLWWFLQSYMRSGLFSSWIFLRI